MRILAFGDVVGNAGRAAIKEYVPLLRQALQADFVWVNGENAAGGLGLDDETLNNLLGAGADVVTTGNHIWKHKSFYNRLNSEKRVLRPANYPPKSPGQGHLIHTLPDGRQVALLNLLGLTYMQALACPFSTALAWCDALDAEHPSVKVRLVDFHAEATSEKKCLGWALDGRVSAVIGTHTHVQTADAHILPHGTAYMTDMGMCGVELSALGMDADAVVQHFISKMPVRFKVAKGKLSINAVFMDVDESTGQAREIRALREGCPACVSQPEPLN